VISQVEPTTLYCDAAVSPQLAVSRIVAKHQRRTVSFPVLSRAWPQNDADLNL